MVRKQFRFSGRVQGVGFRITARGIAHRHPITGWVQNLPGGDVLLEAQGPAAAIAAFLNDLRQQMGRNIHEVQESELPPDPAESSFEIRR